MKKLLMVQNQGKITYGSSLRSYPLFIEDCLFVAIGIKHLSFVISVTLPSNPCFRNAFHHRTVQLNGWHFSMLNLWLN